MVVRKAYDTIFLVVKKGYKTVFLVVKKAFLATILNAGFKLIASKLILMSLKHYKIAPAVLHRCCLEAACNILIGSVGGAWPPLNRLLILRR